jgi:hypothetical protein
MLTSGTTIQVNENISLNFPTDSCCNCGTNHDIQILYQDTRLTRFMGWGGSEYTLKFPLPFCPRCMPTAHRRPPTNLKRFLVVALLFVGFLFLFTIVGIGLQVNWLLENAWVLSTVIAVIVGVAWYATRRVTLSQTSYYQPIRIKGMKQEFLSVKVKTITLVFTNSTYSQQFITANGEAMQSGTVQVVAR